MSSIAFLLITLAAAVGVGALHFAAQQDRALRSERHLFSLDRRHSVLSWPKARSTARATARTARRATRATACVSAG